MILVLTPLAFESKFLRPHLGSPGEMSEHHGVQVHRFCDFRLAVATGGHGKVQFALGTQMLIRELSPRLVICAGACGGLHSTAKPLDVIAGERTIEHDFNLRFEKRALPQFTGDEKALAHLRNEPAWPGFRLHFGGIASGDEDIVDPTRAGAVFALTGALAVAWEGAGGARAAAFCKTPYLELRVITDLSNASAPQHFKENIKAGMQNLAAVILRLNELSLN